MSTWFPPHDLTEATPLVASHTIADFDLTFLISEKGKPFASAASLGTSFRKWCDKAGVSKSIHGIRKFNAEAVPKAVPPSKK